MAAPPNPQQHVDMLSQMQAELTRLSDLMLSTVGELQQSALPVTVDGEDLLRPTSTSYDAEARSQGFAKEIIQVMQSMFLFVGNVPRSLGFM